MAVAHKGSISMGMVLIPVGLYKTTVDNDIHFNQLEKESKARIKYKKYCSHCGKEVQTSDIMRFRKAVRRRPMNCFGRHCYLRKKLP